MQPILDPQAIANLRAISPDDDGVFFRELIEVFLQDTPQRIQEIRSAVSAKTPAIAARAAHTIKGSSGNFGACDLSSLAASLEKSAKEGNLAAVESSLPRLDHEFARVRDALQALIAT